MKTRKLGASGLEVTEIILGTWAIGGTMWSDYDETAAVKAIEAAIDNGINCIDTAPAYGAGHADELIGSIISGRRDKIIIASKCGLDIENGYRHNLKPDFVIYDLEQSLKRLGTDYIDLYQIHWPDPETPIEETMPALIKAKESGKIRNIGICNFSGEQLKEAMKYGEIASFQPNYSLLERGIESDQMNICVENNIGIISYGSLGAGMLTGKYKEHPQFKRNDARNFFYRFFKKQYWPQVKAVVDKVSEIAEKHRVKPGHVAIAWNLSKTGISAAIVGARTPEQIIENIGGSGLSLTAEEILELDRVSENIYDKISDL
jgi:aryl-alcohol dehydrogenase-like predicted oxidoreductase